MAKTGGESGETPRGLGSRQGSGQPRTEGMTGKEKHHGNIQEVRKEKGSGRE